MNDKGAESAAATPREVVQAPEFRSVYSNGAGVRFTPFDITVIFGRIVGTGGGAVRSEELVEVTCAPSHMKAIAEALTASVQVYEERFGKINPVVPFDPSQIRKIADGLNFKIEDG